MIQLRCGKCKMVINLDEKLFRARYKHPDYDRSDDILCTSCGALVPYEIQACIKTIVETPPDNGWELGTMLF